MSYFVILERNLICTGITLAVKNDRVKIVSVEYARQAVKEYPGCQYIEIQGGGHMFRGKYDQEAKNHIRAFFGQTVIENWKA